MLIFFKNAHRKANDNLFRFLMTSIQSLNYTNRAVRVHVLYCAVTSCWETCDRIIKVAITYTLKKKKTYSGSRSRRVLCRQQKGELFHILDKLKVTFFIIENWKKFRIENSELGIEQTHKLHSSGIQLYSGHELWKKEKNTANFLNGNNE